VSISVTNRTMRFLSSVLVVCLCANGSFAAGADDTLRLNVLTGQDVVVTTATGHGPDIKIRVTDKNSAPVEGATVSVILPAVGSGGHFAGGSTIATRQTDSDGIVDFSGIRLRKLNGDFAVKIRARKESLTGSTQVVEKVSWVAEGPQSFFSPRHVLMMWIAGAGVAAGILAATIGGPNGGTPAAAGLTVTPGTPITGGPR
jgi:hypothetical protein